MKRAVILIFMFLLGLGHAMATPTKSKFYDFADQLINGELKRPAALYTDARTQVKFERLLSLKKSFLPKLYSTAKERVFK